MVSWTNKGKMDKPSVTSHSHTVKLKVENTSLTPGVSMTNSCNATPNRKAMNNIQFLSLIT